MEPEVDRRAIHYPKIDSEDFEITAYVGALSVEDFGASTLSGARLAIHANEDFFIEGSLGSAVVTDETYNNMNLPIFGSSRTEELQFMSIGIGYNLFPGETFVTDSLVLTSSAYFLLGAGSTTILNEDHFTLMFGMGLRMLPTDWLAVRFEARGHEFESNLLGVNKYSHNFEASMGLSLFF
jgi:outer membrane beta-barrel protein